MKGVDAALWAVCDALGLEIQALPVYSPDLDDDYSGDDRSAGDPLDLFSRRANSRISTNVVITSSGLAVASAPWKLTSLAIMKTILVAVWMRLISLPSIQGFIG